MKIEINDSDMTPAVVNFVLPPAAYVLSRARKGVAPQCGPCTLCCKVMGVPEINKPKDQWCPHAKAGKGCCIYDTRPERCATFSCLWLSGHFGDGQVQFRPDRIHAVVTPTTDGQNWVLHEDPGYEGFARQALKTVIGKFVADGKHYVVVVCGTKRAFIGNPAIYKALVDSGVHPGLVK